jgi:hypothetical protein
MSKEAVIGLVSQQCISDCFKEQRKHPKEYQFFSKMVKHLYALFSCLVYSHAMENLPARNSSELKIRSSVPWSFVLFMCLLPGNDVGFGMHSLNL